MSQTMTCRLCLNTCEDHKNLYDEQGVVYKVVATFFPPRFVESNKDCDSKVICLLCWRIISEFSNYLESVKQAQNKLRKGIKNPVKFTAQQSENVYPTGTLYVNSITTAASSSEGKTMKAKKQKTKISNAKNELNEIADTVVSMENVVTPDETPNPHYGDDDPALENIATSDETPANSYYGDADDAVADQENTLSRAEIELDQLHNKIIAKIASAGQTLENIVPPAECSITNVIELDSSSEDSQQSLQASSNANIALEQFHNQMISNLCLDKEIQTIELAASPNQSPTTSIVKDEPIQTLSIDDSSNEDDSSNMETDIEFEEYEEPVGTFRGGEFDNHVQDMDIYGQQDDSSLSESVASSIPCHKNHTRMDGILAKWRKTLDCYICHEVCSNFTCLRDHFSHKHSKERFYFPCCNHKFYCRSKLVDHAKFHLFPESFKCEICGKCFDRSIYLANHRQRHKKLSLKGKTKKELDDIIAQWKANLECEICNELFPSYEPLCRHFEQQHPNVASAYIACCNRNFNSRSKILRHARFHLNFKKNYKCQLCGKRLQNSNALSKHHLSVHFVIVADDIETNYTCNLCRKVFHKVQDIKQHVLSHAMISDGLFKCPDCSNMFETSTSYENHRLQTHSQK